MSKVFRNTVRECADRSGADRWQLSEGTPAQLLSAVIWKLIFSNWRSDLLSSFLLGPQIQPPRV